MSVVEKQSPHRRHLSAAVVGAAALVVVALVVANLVDGESNKEEQSSLPSSSLPLPSSTFSVNESFEQVRPTLPTTTTPAPRVTALDTTFGRGASYRVYLHQAGTNRSVPPHVFAYIDLASGELRYLDQRHLGLGQVVGQFGDRLVISGAGMYLIDRDFRERPRAINGHRFVGAWRDVAIVAEDFGERTTFRPYRADGSEARPVALVGRAPDVIAGVVGDDVVVERAGRILQVSLAEASVRELATGHLVGVGGDHIFYTDCAQGPAGLACSLFDVTRDGVVRATPIGPYVVPGTDTVTGRVAPDGSAVVLLEPRTGTEVVLRGGARLPLSDEGGPRPYVWGPSGQLFLVDARDRQLDVIDYQPRRVTTVALPSDVASSLSIIAVW